MNDYIECEVCRREHHKSWDACCEPEILECENCGEAYDPVHSLAPDREHYCCKFCQNMARMDME